MKLTEEMEYCLKLINILEGLIEFLEENPVEYAPLMMDVVCLQYGRIVKTKNGHILVNGLEIQIQELYETLEKLELEIWRELGGDECEM